jgi:hypothetical protein
MTVDAARPMLERRDYKGDQCSLDTDVGALAHIVSLSHEAGLDNRLPDTCGVCGSRRCGTGSQGAAARLCQLFRVKRT